VRRSPTLFALLRSPARAEPFSWAVVFALLAQLWLGTPMAVRMGVELAAIGGDAHAHCGEQEALPAGAPALPSHDHEQCVLCQLAAAPMLLVEAPALRAAPHPAASPASTPIRELHFAAAPLAYASRAPPLNA
jgi:hypothetical protein